MKKRPLPESADQLLQELFSIFPQYREIYSGPIHNDTPSFHSVLLAFSPYAAGIIQTSTEAQMRQFGNLVNNAVATDGPLENAFGTCFLEHLHQIKASKTLSPYLSQRAREKTHA